MRRFVTFEGIEGCGKTTQIELAAVWLKERGIPFLATAEPGGTPLGRKIREILLNRGSWTISAETELLLFAAARAQHVRETILPAIEEGRWVLCDRFTDATLAYQGFGRDLDAAFIRTLNAFSALSLTGRSSSISPSERDWKEHEKGSPACGRRRLKTASSRKIRPFTGGSVRDT
jgi:dTMP kinase